MTMKFKEIQEAAIKEYCIELCDGTKCDGTKCPHAWRRMHSCRMARKIYKFKFENSVDATFGLFHEIGHQETTTSKMRRCESEYYATVWAINECKKYDIEVPDRIIERYQAYIDMEKARGKRRGGSGYGDLKLPRK